jgi:DNA-directed RNA polymerase-4/5 subunit 7
MVFHEAEMSWNVLISPDQMSPKGLLLRKSIIERLLKDIKCRKASEEHGYYIAVNELNAIAEGEVCELTGDVSFPVTFTCLTQKPRKGETLVGSVEKILELGVFLKSGLIENIFLSYKAMGDYRYIGGDNPMFMKDHSKLEKGTIVRFKVLDFLWVKADRQFQLLATMVGDFQLLATMVGDFLGPL